MKSSILHLASVPALFLAATSNAAFAHSASNAKVAELSLHRVERLVILKKIEDTFENRISSLALSLIPHQNEEDPSFKATLSQLPAPDGTSKSIDIIMNEEGKALSFAVNPGGDATVFPKWPDKDAVTLCENSLHFVQDNLATVPKLKPYNDGLTSLSLSEGTNGAGALVAVVEIHAGANDPTLRVTLKADGTVESTSMIAPTAGQ